MIMIANNKSYSFRVSDYLCTYGLFFIKRMQSPLLYIMFLDTRTIGPSDEAMMDHA